MVQLLYENTFEQNSDQQKTADSFMKTLQQCALQTLQRNLSVFNVFDAFHVASQFDTTDWGKQLQGDCLVFVAMTYETLRVVQGEQAIGQCFGRELVQQLEQQVKERQQILRSLSIRGHVVEQEQPEMPGDTSMTNVSGAGPAVPYAMLKRGVTWPAHVVSDQRETYLSSAEFQQVFGMSYAVYAALPAWKKKQLKEQHQLF